MHAHDMRTKQMRKRIGNLVYTSNWKVLGDKEGSLMYMQTFILEHL